MSRLALVFAVSLSSMSTLHAQQQSDYRPELDWRQVCESAAKIPLPTFKVDDPLSSATLPKCDETALYYGIGAKPDDAAALQCGWYQYVHPQTTVGNMFYGPGVLSMLYANGRGVPRNYDLAIRFACENGWASEFGTEYRIGHLEHLRATAPPTANFDLCDDDGSGLSQGCCASIPARLGDVTRDRKIQAIVVRLPSSARSTLPALKAAEAVFEDSRVRQEVDLSGTARAAFEWDEQTILRDQFLINLQRFGQSDVPQASAADLAVLDKSLNSAYQAVEKESPDYTTITPQGIQKTERAWLRLVDAWLVFSRVAYPQLPPVAIRAQLIRLRLHQLRSLASH